MGSSGEGGRADREDQRGAIKAGAPEGLRLFRMASARVQGGEGRGPVKWVVLGPRVAAGGATGRGVEGQQFRMAGQRVWGGGRWRVTLLRRGLRTSGPAPASSRTAALRKVGRLGSPWGEKEVRLSCSGVWGPGPCTRTPSCRLDYSGRVSPAKRGMREFRGDGREGLGVQ